MQSGGTVSDDMYDGFKAIITAHTNNLVFLNNTHRELSDTLKAMAQAKVCSNGILNEAINSDNNVINCRQTFHASFMND